MMYTTTDIQNMAKRVACIEKSKSGTNSLALVPIFRYSMYAIEGRTLRRILPDFCDQQSEEIRQKTAQMACTAHLAAAARISGG